MPFAIGVDILQVKEVVLHMFLIHNYERTKIDSYYSLPVERNIHFA